MYMQVKHLIKTGFILGTFALTAQAVFAQAKPRKKTTRTTNGYSNYGNTSSNYSNYGNPKTTPGKADTTKPGNQPAAGFSNYGSTENTDNAYTGIDTTLPIQVMPSTGGGLLDSLRPSLRNDAAVDRNLVKDRTPLEYENIREDDAVYRARVWREIDTREKINLPFRYAAVEDNGSQRFISIVLKAIKDGEVTAFSGDDDRFTTPITPEQAENAFGGGADTVASRDLEGNVVGYQVRPKPVDADSIYKFRIKEEWIFDKETSRMFVRILGIAPIVSQKLSTGDVIPNSEHPVWWVYYPDMRTVLSKYEAYNPKNAGARMTWEELFENRMFSSYITKSTLDNPYDQQIKEYVKDPLFRLYEGENVKDKIFNYEQSLWSY